MTSHAALRCGEGKGDLMNKWLVVALLALSMSVYPLTGCASSARDGAAPEEAEEQTEAAATDEGAEAEDAADGAEAADGDVLAGGPDVEGETEEQARILEREELACEFVRVWGTTTTFDPDDDTIVSNVDDWFEHTLSYVKPDSQLYADFMARDQYEGPGFIDAATAVLDARCTGHDGGTYSAVTTQVGTQSGMAGWTEQTYELTHEITFDKDDWVVRVDQWG